MGEGEKLAVDPERLAKALEAAGQSKANHWDLAVAGHILIQRGRYEEATAVYDAILSDRSLEEHAYCNALWVVQRDNTRLPLDEERARRYLAWCLPHASTNPPLHLNASGVLCELGDHSAALDQLLAAARRGVPLEAHLGSALFEPLARDPRWAEVERLAKPIEPRFDALLKLAGVTARVDAPIAHGINPRAFFKQAAPKRVLDALVRGLDDDDARIRQVCVRQLMWWLHEDGDDGMGSPVPEWKTAWYDQIGALIAREVPVGRLAEVIGRDLASEWVHAATYSLDILPRVHSYTPGIDAALEHVAPHMQRLLAGDDAYCLKVASEVLWSFSYNPATHPVLGRGCFPQALRLLEQMSSEGSISDFARARLGALLRLVDLLDHVAHPGLGPALIRLASESRGELYDDPVRWHLVIRLGLDREQGAAALFARIAEEERDKTSYVSALRGLGWMRADDGAAALLAAVRRAGDPNSPRFVREAAAEAAISRLQRGETPGCKVALTWFDDRPYEYYNVGAFTELLHKLIDAGERLGELGRLGDAQQELGPALLDKLRELERAVHQQGSQVNRGEMKALVERAIVVWSA